ncbi:MAG: thiol-disulfide oxidoreductase DCC family protein [Bacteroidota bacterium]|nr:thiol-disulfide oxidoreductase DCC family protein [Bacteroidota bacterium]
MDKFPDKLILFDGVCNLCNRSVQFVIRHDPNARFHFASLQSATGQEVFTAFGLADQQLDSFVLLDNGKAYTQSTAALRVSAHLAGAWKLLYAFLIVPPFIRNAVYRWIARNRYQWFGKRDACMIPSPELSQRFLD